MKRNLPFHKACQVFLNHPFDNGFEPLADALAFAAVAGNMLPVAGRDLSSPDQPRLQMLVEAISNCDYSAHDLSRCTGEGIHNFARMNMPIEMGMAMFYALHSQREQHRCVFFVPTHHEYQAFASDLAGLDPKCHNSDQILLVSQMYDWLRTVVPGPLFNSQPTIDVATKFREFQKDLQRVRGSGAQEAPTYEERRELMYQTCAAAGWWDWRETRSGKDAFPTVPLAWKTGRRASRVSARRSSSR